MACGVWGCWGVYMQQFTVSSYMYVRGYTHYNIVCGSWYTFITVVLVAITWSKVAVPKARWFTPSLVVWLSTYITYKAYPHAGCYCSFARGASIVSKNLIFLSQTPKVLDAPRTMPPWEEETCQRVNWSTPSRGVISHQSRGAGDRQNGRTFSHRPGGRSSPRRGGRHKGGWTYWLHGQLQGNGGRS